MKKSRWIVAGCIYSCIVWLLFPLKADACSCVPTGPPRQEMAESDAVFSGKVIRISEESMQKRVIFHVDSVWKGIETSEVMVVTHSQEPACGYPFVEGERYLVYARVHDQGEWTTSICSRTKLYSSAKDDLQELGTGKPPSKHPEPDPVHEAGKVLLWCIYLILAAAVVNFLRHWLHREKRER
ncbi:hypothetical protein [Lihuaxuella thermophila]|uniref:Tissue inhibitor of metalloproteinase n=1 Tax=Lihuaxuella thermophila TaxID=1173111 RepID=A0A1H8G3Y0_9BACL|nr:hypothetical protein [Lihuaxuella thermophila]SEN38465.1 Tissue inhibitor of metalloproteinase [Lihuaxuella thermophila]